MNNDEKRYFRKVVLEKASSFRRRHAVNVFDFRIKAMLLFLLAECLILRYVYQYASKERIELVEALDAFSVLLIIPAIIAAVFLIIAKSMVGEPID